MVVVMDDEDRENEVNHKNNMDSVRFHL
jgi:3,4-dihydroxy-2-butanone 4-phosphate synthase